MFSSAPPEEQTPGEPTVQPTLPAPVGACQAKLTGKVTNTTTGQSPANVVVEITSAGKTIKTITDPNGLYGFAGLCAGDYAVNVTPPNGKAQPGPQVPLDGAKAVKQDLTFK